MSIERFQTEIAAQTDDSCSSIHGVLNDECAANLPGLVLAHLSPAVQILFSKCALSLPAFDLFV